MSVDVIRPRCLVEIRATVGGRERIITATDGLARVVVEDSQEVATAVVPSECSWTVTPHNRAASCEVTISTSALPFHQRHVHAVALAIYAGLGDDDSAALKNLRFLGDVDEPTAVFGKTSLVTLKARDLSARGRDVPMPTACTPRYSDSVKDAVQRIVDGVPGMKDVLTVRMEQAISDKSLSRLVGKKGRASPVQLKHGISAWEAIEAVCGMAALLPSVFLDELVIRRPGSAFGDPGQRDPSRPAYDFVWGASDGNTEEVRFHKKFIRNRRGFIAYGYDLLGLLNGDRINIRVRPDVEVELRRRLASGDRDAAVQFLRQRLLVDDDTARAMVAILEPESFDLYLASTITHVFHGGSSPETRVQFFNLLRA